MVQEDVRTLCGVALSNMKVFPCIFVACFAIALGRYRSDIDIDICNNAVQLAIASLCVKTKNGSVTFGCNVRELMAFLR